jgi:uncharacterized protein HemY
MSSDRVIRNSAHKLAQHVLKKYRHAMICAIVEKFKFIAELTLQTSATAVVQRLISLPAGCIVYTAGRLRIMIELSFFASPRKQANYWQT